MKLYNVSLSNNSCIFDSHDGFTTAAEAVDFAADRGGKYRVYVDAGNARNTIMATYYTDKDSFAVDEGFDYTFMTRAHFARYLEITL